MFFGYKHEIYVIAVPYKGITVERKFSDFVSLRENLIKLYPGYIIPLLPKKAPQKFTPEVLAKYKDKMQKFLAELFEHPLLKRSYVLCQFVLEKSYKKYKSAKKRLSKEEMPRCVGQCFTVEGAADVSFDPMLENKCEEMDHGLQCLQKNLDKYFHQHRRLKELDKSLIADIGRIGETLGQISETYEAISENYVVLEESKMMEIFISLAEVTAKTSASLIQIKQLYKVGIAKFLNSHGKELESMKVVVEGWRQAQERLGKAHARLDEKKKEILESIPIDKWEIQEDCLRPADDSVKGKSLTDIVPDETKEVDTCKELYGYFCNRIPEEFKRMWVKDAKTFRVNFHRVSENCASLFSKVSFAETFPRCNSGGRSLPSTSRN